jgi:2-(1,2-epoxy-1,2-dihydrophenyl)acetyl-CoA isomerase
MSASNADHSVEVSRDGAVATVVLNRPDQANALNLEMKQQLRDRLAELAGDPEVRAVVLTGAGRAFCVGQDLREHADALRADAARAFATLEQHYNPIVRQLATMPKPAVAAVNGACVGAGLALALACDLRIAAASARFATAFTGIGLACDSGLSATLARAVGSSRASALVLLGEAFGAEQAAAWGLAHEVVPDERLLDAASELAARLAAGPTLAYAEAKRSLWRAPHQSLDDVLEAEAEAQARLGLTDFHREAVEAFLERRRPRATGPAGEAR